MNHSIVFINIYFVLIQYLQCPQWSLTYIHQDIEFLHYMEAIQSPQWSNKEINKEMTWCEEVKWLVHRQLGLESTS